MAIVNALPAAAAAQDDAFLHANAAGDSVELVWRFLGWQPNQTGYVVRKQYSEISDEWQTIGSGPIRPGFFPGRDWSFLGGPRHQEEAQNRFQSIIESGRNAMDPDELIGGLRSAEAEGKNEFTFLLVHKGFVDAFTSTLLGLAARDVTPRLDENPTYGLFRSYEDGRVDAEPAATAQPIDYSRVSKLEHELAPAFDTVFDHVTITWTYPFAAYIRSALQGFRVFEIVGEERNALDNARLRKPTDGDLNFYVTHEGSDPAEQYTYAVVPFDLFGNEYDAITVEYVPAVDPELSMAPLSGVSISAVWTLRIGAKPSVRIEVGSDVEQSGATGLYIHRTDRDSDVWTAPRVSPELALNTEAFTEESPLTAGELYLYWVEVVRDGETLGRSSKPYYYHHNALPVPPPPAKLEAEHVLRSNRHLGGYLFVRVTPPPDADEHDIVKYSLEWHGRTPDNAEPTYRLRRPRKTDDHTWRFIVHNDESINYQFESRSVNKLGIMSVETTSASVLSPSHHMPKVQWEQMSTSRVPGKRVELTWSYDPETPELAGFRLYEVIYQEEGTQKILLSDESTLGPNASRWVSEPLEPGAHSFHIHAVSEYGVESTLTPFGLTIPDWEPSQ